MVHQYELQFDVVVPSEIPEWTEEGINTLRVAVLERMLASIDDQRCSLGLRTENFDWIMDNTVSPFSYLVCCEAACVNPYSLRDQLIENINRWNKLKMKRQQKISLTF